MPAADREFFDLLHHEWLAGRSRGQFTSELHEDEKQLCSFGDMQEEFGAIGYVKTAIAEYLPGYHQAVNDVLQELVAYTELVHPSGHRGVSLLTVQTANDFSDLLADIGMGRGRPAIRCLRSIFESLVTMLDIAGGYSNTTDRYEDHHAVVMYKAATMEAGLTGLTGNDLRAERHIRRKQERMYKQAHDVAIATWGSQFSKRWADGSLRDRAERHGFANDYSLYGVLSSTIHVSGGGVRGIERPYVEGPVYRFGPDLLDCPLALNEGLRYFRLLSKLFLAIPASQQKGSLMPFQHWSG